MSRRAGNWQASEGSFRRQHPSGSIPKGTSCYKKGLGPGRPFGKTLRSLEDHLGDTIWLRSWGQSSQSATEKQWLQATSLALKRPKTLPFGIRTFLVACGRWGGGVVFSHTIPTKEEKHGPLEHSAPRLSRQLWQPPCRKSWLKSKRTPLSFRHDIAWYWNHPKTQ